MLHLKYAENLRGKGDRLAKVTFRGKFWFCLRFSILESDGEKKMETCLIVFVWIKVRNKI